VEAQEEDLKRMSQSEFNNSLSKESGNENNENPIKYEEYRKVNEKLSNSDLRKTKT
jgi:hypothetical protein